VGCSYVSVDSNSHREKLFYEIKKSEKEFLKAFKVRVFNPCQIFIKDELAKFTLDMEETTCISNPGPEMNAGDVLML